MKAFPVKKLFRLIEEVGEVMQKNPDAEVEVILRAEWQADNDNDLTVRAAAAAPVAHGVEASLGVGTRHHWESVGVGEIVVRIHRPARVDHGGEEA